MLENLSERGKQWKSKHRRFLKDVRSWKGLSRSIQDAHVEVFEEINCLDCANCCRTTGPLFTRNDIERIAPTLGLKPAQFEHDYLRKDEDGDMVLQKVPCPFLGTDNYCSIYEVRPKACRSYPHTDMHDQRKIFKLTLKNAEICPAVLQILKNIEETYKNQ